MAKIPGEPSEVFDEVTRDCREAFGDDLQGIFLFGSGAGSEYVPGKSDINFLILVTPGGMDRLERIVPFFKRWRRRKITLPLLLTREYIDSSLDTFPIEFYNIRERHETVYGEDILATLEIDGEQLRLQCEREIKGKLLHLRQGFLVVGRNRRKLRELISSSVTPFVAIFRALLFIKGVASDAGGMEVIAAVCREYGLDFDLFEELVRLKEGKLGLDGSALQVKLKAYMGEVEKLSRIVDDVHEYIRQGGDT